MEHQRFHLLFLFCTFMFHSTVSTSTVVKHNNYLTVAIEASLSSFLEKTSTRSLLDCAKECLQKDVCNFWAFDPDNNNCLLKVGYIKT